MKHDFLTQPNGNDADRFLAWLQAETVEIPQRTRGDLEGTMTAIFLFGNRACESHLSDEQIGALFGMCFVRANRDEDEQDLAFDHLEFFGQHAQATHHPK